MYVKYLCCLDKLFFLYFNRYKTWVNNPKLAQEMAESVTRKTIGVRCCPVAGIPEPKEEDEEELLEMTREIDLS